jgi:hypothetical protein
MDSFGMSSDSTKNFLTFFFLNISLVFLYILFFKIPLQISEIGNYFCPIDWSICFIPDIRTYSHNIDLLSWNLFFEHSKKINGGISLHSFLYFFSSQKKIMIHSVILNSTIASLCLLLIKSNYLLKNSFLTYLFLMPFFLLYSVGPTKEILLLFGSLLFLQTNIALTPKFLVANLLIFFSRNVFLPIFYFANFFKVKFRFIICLIIGLGVIIPISSNFIDWNFYFYNHQRLSQHIESFKYSSPHLGFLGILISLAKNLLEPYVYLFFKTRLDFTNIVISVNFLYLSICYYFMFRYRNKNIGNFFEIKLFFSFLFFIACYPIVQSRYLLIPALLVIFKLTSKFNILNANN